MYVSDYLSHIVKGEVKQLYVSDIGTTSPNTVQQANIDTLISYLNEANLELHKHFGLLQKELVLTDVTNNSLHNVPLDFLYAISAQYDDGTEVSINNERANYVDKVDENVSILFPAPFKILVKGTDVSLKRDDISIVYVAVPATVAKTTDFIDLPQVYNEAIYNYMAYKAHVSVKGDMKEENNTYYLRYQESLRNIRLLGMVNSDNLDSNVKLTDRGFV
jgi:hypothetical protein|tara:strand:- start:3843 stop:4499 length:657 start_codon:yes stop_codon:yes gene_type:complete